MTTRVDHYRIRCITEDAYVYEWAETKPTTCPNNASHVIDADATAIDEANIASNIIVDPVMEPVVPGSSKVVANDRPAIEVQNGVTGWATIQAIWPREQSSSAKIRACIRFICKASGTGTKVRISLRAKTQGIGEDSSVGFSVTGFVVVTTDYLKVGEIFCGDVTLDASTFEHSDTMAIQIGRDGNNELGAGTNDDVNVPIQIIGVEVEAY